MTERSPIYEIQPDNAAECLRHAGTFLFQAADALEREHQQAGADIRTVQAVISQIADQHGVSGFVSQSEACRLLGDCSPDKVRELAAAGQIMQSQPWMRRPTYRHDSIMAFIDAQTPEAHSA